MSEDTITNGPGLWETYLPRPVAEWGKYPDGYHKYYRGYTAIYAAMELTGATRLAATACSRIGCGLVSVVAQARDDVYRSGLPPDIMVHPDPPEKASVWLGGPGDITAAQARSMLYATGLRARVFDAGAIPGKEHFDRLDDTCIITPHTGEFERAFGRLKDGPEAGARKIAIQSGATVVLKSSKTIIAGPTGRTAVNTHMSPYLAKAGTGDVLAGMISGLVAQGMPHFEACCAAVWIHGEAGLRFGPGLISGDIADLLPGILKDLV